MEKKEKIFIFVIIGLLVVLLIIGSTIGEKSGGNSRELSDDPETILANAQTESNQVKEEEKKDFTDITIDDYLDFYSGDDHKIVLIGRPDCHYCEIAEPILHKIAFDYSNITIHYLNMNNLSDEDKMKLQESDKFFSEGLGTPMFLIVGEKSIIDKVDGLTDYEHYVDFLERNNFIVKEK